ncbi:MAG: secretin N-terminal domain-containing protein [Betaproteobacteria bacterium]
MAFVSVALSAPLHAQNALEIITLRHRTAEQVVPALRPLLEPGGTLSGQRNQLIVRTSPANLADLRLALEALDRPARRLLISVRFDESRDAAVGRIEASGSLSDRGSRFELRAQESRTASGERVDQRVQVLEGSRVVIYSGRSRPVRQRIHTPGGVVPQEVTVVHDPATGFEVVARLTGRGVQLDILGQSGSQQASSSVEAALGQWIHLGSTAGAAAYRSELQQVWLKVEELRD